MALTKRTAVVRQLWPLLTVHDIERSVEFYCHRLGFAVVGQAEPEGLMFWCRLERDGTSIMLQQAEEEDGPAAGRGRGITLYFVCDDADAVYGELSAHGLQLKPPRVANYGMNQLFLDDPDGYSLCFESATERWNG